MNVTKTNVPVRRNLSEPLLRRPVDVFDDMLQMFERPWPLLFGPMTNVMRNVERSVGEWIPRIDAIEKDGELIVLVDLPGLKKENVTVELVEGDLVIHGERKELIEVKDENVVRHERHVGVFQRRLPLAFVADPKLIAASFKDGVLEVKVPIPLEKKVVPTRIHIS